MIVIPRKKTACMLSRLLHAYIIGLRTLLLSVRSAGACLVLVNVWQASLIIKLGIIKTLNLLH